jgi:putative membrane protein
MHPNTLFFIVLTLCQIFQIDSYSLIAFILSVSITDLFVNYIPNIFLSVPDSELVLNILPGHRLVLEGKGYDALFISLLGAFGTLILSLALLPVLIKILPAIHNTIYPFIHWFLLLTIIWMCLIEEDTKKKVFCGSIYLMSGVFGILCLNSPLIKSENVLFPSLIGLFGLSSLLLSLKQGTKLPKQFSDKEIDAEKIWKGITIGFLSGLITGILPGIGQAQAATMLSTFGKLSTREFLSALSGINMANLVFSIISLYCFGKIRSGVAAAIWQVTNFGIREVLFSVCVMIFSGSLAVILTWFLGKKMLSFLQRVNYKLLSELVICLIVFMVFNFSGFIGLFILLISTFMGILPQILGIKRTSNMGFLMIPTFIYFAGLNGLVMRFILP